MTMPDWLRARSESANSCVEVLAVGDTVLLRSSLDPGVELSVTREEWVAFVASIKADHFDSV